MRLTHISDTHCYLGGALEKLPTSDILIHTGDALIRGTIEEFIRFCNTLNNIHKNYDCIFYTPGNHDIIVQKQQSLCREIFKEKVPNGIMLIDEEYIYNGIKIYMFPWTPEFGYGWAYQLNSENKFDIYSKIPKDVDILCNHGMPYGIMDRVNIITKNELDYHVGDKFLAQKIKEYKPSLFLGGHLHEGYGYIKTNDTLYLNGCICDHQYNPINKPWLIDFNIETKKITLCGE